MNVTPPVVAEGDFQDREIRVRGARTHNLKGIDLNIPRNQIVVITGLSGSGKSSLAFDTLYAEGQRRYVESLSAYARQFLSVMDKPDVDHIEGLSPAIAIQQKTVSHNPRSTVGTITEIYDYIRLLYARVGTPHCPDHHLPLNAQSTSQMVDTLLQRPAGERVLITAPMVRQRKGEHVKLFDKLRTQGYMRALIDGVMVDLDDAEGLKLDGQQAHTIEVVVDRLKIHDEQRQRLAESLESATALADGLASARAYEGDHDLLHLFSSRFACPECGYSLSELEPRLFSFNNPSGACPTCDGLGVSRVVTPERVVIDEQISIHGGAIRGWDHHHVHFFHQMNSLAEHYQFNLKTPFGELPEKIRHIILFGSGSERIAITSMGFRGRMQTRTKPYEGVIPNMMRRYAETESETVREELAKYFDYQPCADCGGSRLNAAARHVSVCNTVLPDVVKLSIAQAHDWVQNLDLQGQFAEIANRIIKAIADRLHFLLSVGLNYLTLDRPVETLSGGESQRIRLASQIGSGLVGVMYILDEPSIGLHQRDNSKLLATLHKLRDLGNTIIVVEHDEDAIRQADHLIDIGPGAGVHGGQVIAAGSVDDIIAHQDSITGAYLSGREGIAVPRQRHSDHAHNPSECLTLHEVTTHNLRRVTVAFPVGALTCVTGVSGSGKSSLVNNTLYPLASHHLNGARRPAISSFRDIEGLDHFDKVVAIDQSPIGRTPRSNPATYTGMFTAIRELFAATAEARARGYSPGRFSFNVRGGRCSHCEGDGIIRVEMHFLADVYVACDQCQGRRYNRETLEVTYKGRNIHEVLDMTVEEAREFFDAIPAIANRCQMLVEVGLGYIRLGQSATTLSGGEAQRIKLAKELARRATGRTLYILDEPTTGLHFHDIRQLLEVLMVLRDQGNTLIVIEHNLDVIKCADWLIDMGPEGGSGGGQVIATGTPEAVAQVAESYTGVFLKPLLERG